MSAAIVGIAINPVRRQSVFADPNATLGQIIFIDPQSESVGSMTVFSEETGPVSTGSPELGAADVAYQPFSNTAVSFNSQTKEGLLVAPFLFLRTPTGTTWSR